MRTIETKPEYDAPFAERYFHQRVSRVGFEAGRLATAESVGQEQRFDAEIISGFSEALNGRVRSEYTFDVVDGKILADDGEPLETMMLRSRMQAYELVAHNPLMQFVVDRFEAEIDELQAQQAMTLPDAPYNTLITNSPMSFELQHRPDLLKKGFQRPDLNRSMCRVSHWDGKKMHILTRSLDASTIDLLSSATYDTLGYRYNASSSLGMLQERIERHLSIEQARDIADRLCQNYDMRFYEKTGLRTEQGSLPINNRDLMEFVQSHPELLTNIRREVDGLVVQCSTYAHFQSELNKCLYRHLALYDELLQGKLMYINDVSASASDAGGRAAESGVVYSMCGELLSSEQKQEGSQTGFESLMSYSGRKVQCPNSQCKKFVVVEDRFLHKGVLHCKACKHTLDVCGDSAKAKRIKQSEMKKAIQAEEKAVKNAKRILGEKKLNWWS